MTELTVEERLSRIEQAGWPLAFDGCHKIYFLQDPEREAEAGEFGYTIHEASEIHELYAIACGLRFVSRWGHDNDDFDHEFNIDQFEDEDGDS